jgi:hypothetical protein
MSEAPTPTEEPAPEPGTPEPDTGDTGDTEEGGEEA